MSSNTTTPQASSLQQPQPPPPEIIHRATTDPDVYNAAVWSGVFNKRRGHSSTSPTSSVGKDRLPVAIVRATHPSHARVAVELARSLGPDVRVSVRSGGHSWAAWSVRSDAILLDLSGLMAFEGTTTTEEDGQEKEVAEGVLQFDGETGVVSAPPSCTGRMLNRWLEGKGRMFAGGHCPDVGLGGFLLQGGMGWNCKNWGWACESVVGIDVVTADARELHCSVDENKELFWAARGAGPGFPAIVTRFHLQTRPLLGVWQSIYIYPVSSFKSVLQFVIDASRGADPDTEMVVVSSYTLLDPSTPASELSILANFTTFKPTLAEAQAALRPLHDDPRRPRGEDSGCKVELFCRQISLEHEYCSQTTASPPGHRYCCDDSYVANEPEGGVSVPDVLEEAFTTLPRDTRSFALYYAMHPTSRRSLGGGSEDEGGMALSMQSDHYFAVYTTWKEEKDDVRCEGWVRDTMNKVERHEVGSYLGDADFRARRTRFWSEENGARLREVRRRWDPEGRICGFLDEGDASGLEGLRNEFEWK